MLKATCFLSLLLRLFTSAGSSTTTVGSFSDYSQMTKSIAAEQLPASYSRLNHKNQQFNPWKLQHVHAVGRQLQRFKLNFKAIKNSLTLWLIRVREASRWVAGDQEFIGGLKGLYVEPHFTVLKRRNWSVCFYFRTNLHRGNRTLVPIYLMMSAFDVFPDFYFDTTKPQHAFEVVTGRAGRCMGAWVHGWVGVCVGGGVNSY